MARIYLASSWRNPLQPDLVNNRLKEDTGPRLDVAQFLAASDRVPDGDDVPEFHMLRDAFKAALGDPPGTPGAYWQRVARHLDAAGWDICHDDLYLNVAKVYEHVTEGRISKPHTIAEDVIGEADAALEKAIKEGIADEKVVDEAGPRTRPVMMSVDHLVAQLEARKALLDRKVGNGRVTLEDETAIDIAGWLGQAAQSIRELAGQTVDDGGPMGL